MDMSDTPETDAFIERNIAHGPTGWEWRVYSRRLERERDEARDVVVILCDGEPKRDFAKECKRLECELEKAHNEFLIANNKMVNAECEAREIASVMEKVKQERDELRAYLDTAHYATCNAELRQQRSEAREKYCEVLTDNMLHIATIARLERERDETKLFIEELVDLVAYGLGQQESIWSQTAMRKAREAIAKAKNF